MSRKKRRAQPAAGFAIAGGLLVVALLGGCHRGSTPQQQAQSYLNAAVKAQQEGQVEAATSGFKNVLSLEPRNKYALFDLGLLAQRAGSSDVADKYYRQALDADPNFRPALFNLAVVRYQVGANEEAATLYRRIIALDPSAATSHLNLGFALLAMGDVKNAGKEFEAAVKLDPSLTDRLGKDASAALMRVQDGGPSPELSPSVAGEYAGPAATCL
jgi:tetratricopeptide (TPR) repeat protein